MSTHDKTLKEIHGDPVYTHHCPCCGEKYSIEYVQRLEQRIEKLRALITDLIEGHEAHQFLEHGEQFFLSPLGKKIYAALQADSLAEQEGKV